MKRIIFVFLLSFCLAPFMKAQAQPSYSQWLFVQGDKALQYRIAVLEQKGDVATLGLQFRVNDEDEVYCKSDLCNGMLLSMRNVNAGEEVNTQYSFIFEKSFKGLNNIYTWPGTITTELKTWPDGSKRYFSATKGIVYTNAGSETEYVANVPDGCVDVRLTNNPDQHRCERHGFDASAATIVK